MGLIAIDKYDETEQDGIFSYVLIFFLVIIISSFVTAAVIRSFQNDETKSMQISPLISPIVKAAPLGVAISEAATRPFATDTLTPYQEQLREAVVLDSKVGTPVKDSVPEEISRPKAESRIAETHVEKNRPVARTVRRNKVLLARAAAPSVASKPVEAAPVAEAVDKMIPKDSVISEKSAAVQPVRDIPVATTKSPESTLVASIEPAQANTALPIADKTVENVSGPAAEKKNPVSYSSSLHSPSLSPSGADSEIKTTTADTARDTAAADIPKEDDAKQTDKNADKKDKGMSFMTIMEWTARIVGLALFLLK